MKTRLRAAQKGHSLLKKKADALQIRFRSILGKIVENKQLMGEVMRQASFSLAEARFAAGDFNHAVIENAKSAKVKVRVKSDNVAGVRLPIFDAIIEGGDAFEYTGLGRGGQQVQNCKSTYFKAVELLVELASLQTSFVTLDEVIKVTNRRVNAIEHVIIPRVERTIHYINRQASLRRAQKAQQPSVPGSATLTAAVSLSSRLAAQRAGRDGPRGLFPVEEDPEQEAEGAEGGRRGPGGRPRERSQGQRNAGGPCRAAFGHPGGPGGPGPPILVTP